LYAAALGIEILCIAAAEIGENTGLYIFGFNTKGLFTEEEYSMFPESENKPIRLIYLNPDIWTNERIEQEAWRFEGMRTLPGRTYVRDVNGNVISGPYMLCIGDIDSEGAYRKCQKELQNDWINVTYVTKSRKEFGNHFYWLEDWSDDNDFITIDDNDLKSQDGLFEIGIGLKYTQLAGRHRKDANFRYRNVGCLKLKAPEIMIRNGLYDTPKITKENFTFLTGLIILCGLFQ
jgi:hypothetical protein